MKKSCFHCFFFILLFSIFDTNLSAQEVKFSGEAGTAWASALRPSRQGDFILGDSYLNGKIDAFYENSSAFAEGSVGFDEVSDEIYFELKEAYLDYSSDFWGLRIGRQKISWGKADGIDISNVLCPKDYSSVRSIFNDEKLAIDTVRLTLSKASLSLDTYFIPFFIKSPLLEEYSSQISDFRESGKNIKNSEYALKFSGYFSHLDLSIYGFYGFEDSPFLSYKPKIEGGTITGYEISAEYERFLMLALDAAIPLGQTVLRLETAFFPKRHFQSKAEKILSGSKISEKHDNLLSLIGLDWMPNGWTFTAQYFCDALSGDSKNLEREKNYTHGTSLSISKSLFSETLELSASCLLNFSDFDSAAQLSAEYSLTDSIFLEAGGYIFNEGKEKGTYGLYKDYTSFYIKARYVF
ncbi:MAG: hypothetical protein IJ630_05520 [Treponema sp.]|nr:hypothetical protein [Treponema sp.]